MKMDVLFPYRFSLKINFPEIRMRRKKNPCCAACGNPAYPQCMDCCSLFDD